MQPQFSIITVSYNAAGTIAATLNSLREQTARNYELVVIDGGSTDGTLDVVRRYDDLVNVLVSEKDNGIYDAMNKGVRAASGEYVFFLNADDRFADRNVLQTAAEYLNESPGTDLLFGNVIYDFRTRRERRRFEWITRERLLFGHLCHQAVIARRELFNRLGFFDCQLRIAADYEWLLRVFHAGVQWQYIDRDIALFHAGGAHAANAVRLNQERSVIQSRYLSAPALLMGTIAFRLRRRLNLLRGYRGEMV